MIPTLNDIFKHFKFFFDIRGVETEELQNAPTGLREMSVEYSRSKIYSGLLRNITGQLEFVGKGAYILRREYAKYRLLARLNLRIEQDKREPYNTYENIYTGRLDFTKKEDGQNSFTVGAKSFDFSSNIDAYDSQQYAIPLTDGINVELPGIKLTETPQFIVNATSDHRSDAFFVLTIAQYNQMSINPSVQSSVGFVADASPTFDKNNYKFFFIARTDTKVQIQGNIITQIQSGHFQFNIYKSDGTLVKTLFDSTFGSTTDTGFSFNFVIDVLKDDRLFFYVLNLGFPDTNVGAKIYEGYINLFYDTITQPTMCQALRGADLFGRLLQAMNVNQDSGPNLPVAYQSFLLTTGLLPLVFTSSDSIRNAQGSIFVAGDTIGPGVYRVATGESITYATVMYTVNQTFSFIPGITSFTGGGAVQKIQSILNGLVYNIGDSLQAGATYLVEGASIVYNSISYDVGDFFKYVLGQETFTSGDPAAFVKQIAVDPQIIISFTEFFQCLKSVQGGDIAFGALSIPFIETLANVYRSGASVASLGNVPKDWKSACATDMMYNKIKVGQEDQQYDAINGSQEVSSTQYYGSALLDPVAELDLVSKVRFDPFGIETVRITQNDTAASRSDNDTFGLWINTTPVSEFPFEYYRPLGNDGLSQPISGVPASYYNWMLSPKRNLLRGSRYLASIFFGMKGYQLRLTGYKKNIGMITVGLDGIRVVESDPVEIASLGTPYFIPEYFTFTIPAGLIDSNSYAPVDFNVNGVSLKGFVSNYKANFATNTPQEVKLLLTADNNLDLLVR